MNQSICIRWERHTEENQRYYFVYLHRDLLGDLILLRAWGGVGKATGQIHKAPVESPEEGLKMIDQIIKKRIQRGYELVSGLADIQAFANAA